MKTQHSQNKKQKASINTICFYLDFLKFISLYVHIYREKVYTQNGYIWVLALGSFYLFPHALLHTFSLVNMYYLYKIKKKKLMFKTSIAFLWGRGKNTKAVCNFLNLH